MWPPRLRRSCLAVVAAALTWPAHAGWFAKAEPEPVPDGTVTITFPYVASLDMDPARIRFTARYLATRPDEPGVKTVTHQRSTGPVFIPVPLGTYKETLPVERVVALKPEWIRLDGPNRITVRVPEGLAGPGAYRLRELSMECGEWPCQDKESTHSRTLSFSDGAPDSPLPAALDLGTDRRHTLTAGHVGSRVHLIAAEGSYSSRAQQTTRFETAPRRAVQDAAGEWHLSDTAFSGAPRSACGEAVWHWPRGQLDARSHASLAWAQPYAQVNHGPVYGAVGKLTGCIQVEGRGTTYRESDSEIREYHFIDGRPWARDIRRFAFGKMEWVSLEFDGDGQLLFYSRRLYDQKTRQEQTFSWNRLAREARLAGVGPADAAWGAEEALSEGRELLTLVTPDEP